MSKDDPEMSQPNGDAIDVVLFDMGGVLVRLGKLDEELGVANLTSRQFWDRWLTSPSVRSLERGDADVTAFADGLIAEFELTMDRAEVIARFSAVPRGLFPGAIDLVESVPDHIRTGMLSNTNQVHWDTQPDAEIIRKLFSHVYLSFKIGLMKPDPEIFEHVVADLGAESRRVLFIDDNLMNVEGARSAGLCAEVAKGPQEAAEVLAGQGILS